MSTEPDAGAELTTAHVLDAAIKAFIEQQVTAFGTRFSMRTLTDAYLPDIKETTTLSRWTNPGKRSNWKIPTHRIPSVAEAFGAPGRKKLLLNDLMTARLAELSVDAKNETVVIATWLAGFLAPEPDEAALLKVYQKARGAYPHRIFGDKETLAEFEAFFGNKVTALMKSLSDERDEEAKAEQAAEQPGAGEASAKVKRAKSTFQMPTKTRDAFFDKSKELRDEEYSARYRANVVIRELQAQAGIVPIPKLPKTPPK